MNKVLDMLQVILKEAQSLLLVFKVSAADFEYLSVGQRILGLEQQVFVLYLLSKSSTKTLKITDDNPKENICG